MAGVNRPSLMPNGLLNCFAERIVGDAGILSRYQERSIETDVFCTESERRIAVNKGGTARPSSFA